MESSTATAPETTDQTVSPVTFHAEASNYRVVVEPQRNQRVGETNQTEVVGGKDIQFYDGVFVATTQEEIDFLRDYESNGTYYWEVGSPEDKPDDSAGLQRLIIEKALAGDQDAIADILVAERTSQSRPAVIAACEGALNSMGGELPQKPDTPLHELQRVRMGPTAGITPGVSPDPVPGTPAVNPSTLGVPDAPLASPEPGATSVPMGQVPATEAPATDAPADTAEVPSSTVPDARGPLVGGQPGQLGDATVSSDLPPVGEVEPTDTPADHPAADGDGGAPGAPAAADPAADQEG